MEAGKTRTAQSLEVKILRKNLPLRLPKFSTLLEGHRDSTMAHLAGHYNTHVANATNEKIFAKVAEDKIQVKSSSTGANLNIGFGGVNAGGGSNNQTEYFQAELLKDGFAAIAPGDYLSFPAEKPYVSVYTESGCNVCANYRPGPDISIIVTAERTIQQTKYGEIWVDTSGRRH